MSTLRYDPAHRAEGPWDSSVRPVPGEDAGRAGPIGRRGHGDGDRRGRLVGRGAGEERGGEPAATGRRDRRGVAPPARWRRCASAGRIRDPRRRRRLDRPDTLRSWGTGRGLSRAAGDRAGGRGGPVVGDDGRHPRRPGRLDRDAGRRPAERPGRPGAALGGPARPRRRAGLAGGSSRCLVPAGDQPLGEPGAQRRAGPVDPRHGCSVRIFPREVGVAVAGVPRRAPVLRARSCCARDAGWCRCRSAIGPDRTAGRTTTCGTGRSRWSSTCSAWPGCCAGRCDIGWSGPGMPARLGRVSGPRRRWPSGSRALSRRTEPCRTRRSG